MQRFAPSLCLKLEAAIDALASDPYQGKKLVGDLSGQWSLRVGSYRIIYEIFKDKLLIRVIDLGHRREIYR